MSPQFTKNKHVGVCGPAIPYVMGTEGGDKIRLIPKKIDILGTFFGPYECTSL